jgi:hypothetical protein
MTMHISETNCVRLEGVTDAYKTNITIPHWCTHLIGLIFIVFCYVTTISKRYFK